ncbi:MAG TPA: helix-turn-helix transcriptional regulator [Candidatus Angelobacter sp.]|jgi:transcriptional regulator with XRE-family HTH domain|nr:helix-turn-helix transcriptional regulator [Candidatus Angelobacter sp.]
MANDICVHFGRRLQRLRKQKGMKQIDLAVHAGMGRTYISKLENGKIEPGLRALKTLADSFEMTVSQLVKGI